MKNGGGEARAILRGVRVAAGLRVPLLLAFAKHGRPLLARRAAARLSVHLWPSPPPRGASVSAAVRDQ
eukprot:3228486-Prymnesium_polylepis.1